MPPRAQCGAPPTARRHLPAVRSRCEQRRDGAKDGGRRTCDRELRLRSAAKQPEPAVGQSRLGWEGRRREQRFVPDPAPRAQLARGAGCSAAWRATLQAVLARPTACARVTCRHGGGAQSTSAPVTRRERADMWPESLAARVAPAHREGRGACGTHRSQPPRGETRSMRHMGTSHRVRAVDRPTVGEASGELVCRKEKGRGHEGDGTCSVPARRLLVLFAVHPARRGSSRGHGRGLPRSVRAVQGLGHGTGRGTQNGQRDFKGTRLAEGRSGKKAGGTELRARRAGDVAHVPRRRRRGHRKRTAGNKRTNIQANAGRTQRGTGKADKHCEDGGRGRQEDNTAPGFVAIAAQSAAQFAWHEPQLGDAASAGIAATMIYLCNDHKGGSSNGCGSTAGTDCPCAPKKWVVKNGAGSKPTELQTGTNWNALKESTGDANTADKVKTNWDTAKKICEATTHAPQRTRTVSTKIRHAATQLATRILHAENIATQHTTLLCLGTSSGTGCAGAGGQETCICYTEGGTAINNVTEIPFIKAALEAAEKLEQIEHDYEAALRLKSAWLTTNGHTQDADAEEESAEDEAAAVETDTETQQNSSSTSTQKRHRRGTREAPEATRQDGQACAAQGQQCNPRTRTCEAQATQTTHTQKTQPAQTQARTASRAQPQR
ncbi:Trypanosomal VSG domain [Trypanosoma vivax]|nr:Trypanosomal VSG domain [Trypanosoma vivax]